MNDPSTAILERLLRASGLAWMIDTYPPADIVLTSLLQLLERVAAEYNRRLRVNVSFSPQQLEAEWKRNPHKVQGFLQALGISNSAEMLVMVWRILQGLSIRDLRLQYHERQRFELEICLSLPGIGEESFERYYSTDINDVTLLRHFGIAMIRGEPLLDGFYPLRVKDG